MNNTPFTEKRRRHCVKNTHLQRFLDMGSYISQACEECVYLITG